MDVLMIAPQPFFQPRGTPFSVLHRLRAVSRLGHRVDLLTYPLGQDVGIENVRTFRVPRFPMLREIPIGPSLIKLPLDALLIAQSIRMLRRKRYDLLHTHEEAGFWGAYLAKRYRIPHLYDMHSSLPQQLGNFKYPAPRLVVRLFEWLEGRTIREADAVITICPELFAYVESRFPGTHLALIENVMDNAELFDGVEWDEDIKARYHLDGRRIVLYTGTFEPYQGIDLLIRAVPQVLARQGDVAFVLVGGTAEQVDDYRADARRLGVEEWVIFTGSVPPQAIARFVEAADVLVSPRVSGTNTPLKIYSYLRSGKPIVATRHVTHTQVLTDEVAVLTEVGPDGLAKGILEVLGQPRLVERLTANARRLAERKYSREAYLEKTREVYEHLMARGARRKV